MSDDTLDADTLALLVSLQLSDLSDLAATQKGKGRIGIKSDLDLALESYRHDLEAYEQVARDRLLALSQERAVQTDHDALRAFVEVEEAERRDHEAAMNLRRGIPLPPLADATPPAATSSRAARSSNLAPIPGSSVLTDKSTLTPTPPAPYSSSPSSSTPTKPTPTPSTSTSTPSSSQVRGPTSERVECVICTDKLSSTKSIKVPCGHSYCRSCLKELFLQSTINERLMPPSCDRQPIPLDLVRPFLSSAEVIEYVAKKEEFGTKLRLYCHEKACSKFLGAASQTKREVECGACGNKTCEACKGPWHGAERVCAADTDEEAFMALSKELGCQRCPGCRRIVQLDTGCFHMSCLCRTEFCFLCAERWKTCRCPQWEEQRLYSEAERRVLERGAGGNEVVPHNIFRQRVEAAATALRDDHECRNHRWTYRHGAGDCQECGHYLDRFLLRCRNCQMVACKRCTLNRL